MVALPRVVEQTRERVAREFDDLGPSVCVRQIASTLRSDNPELLDMAERWAADVGDRERNVTAFCFFYRLLDLQAREARGFAGSEPLPRVTAETRDAIIREIDARGPEDFTRSAVADLERRNPELLQVAHSFASRHPDYLSAMQGFALFYSSLSAQSMADRHQLH
jgi:hypothetical protein